jgi:small subunit ribosomal protein S8
MITDPIADLLTRIRNASRARHDFVFVPYSKLKESIVSILVDEGFLSEVKVVRNEKFPKLKIFLNPNNTGIMLVRKSTPGRRVYVSHSELRPVKSGYGIGIISTSKGVLTTEDAIEHGIGGEYICEVY